MFETFLKDIVVISDTYLTQKKGGIKKIKTFLFILASLKIRQF